MEITGFNPTSGGEGTPVTISLTGMPADAQVNNTIVLLSGDSSVDVISVDPAAGTVGVTIASNAQSGEFAIVVNSGGDYVDAQSAGTFDVHVPVGQPRITSLIPTTATANAQEFTLGGQNLTGAQFVRVGNTTVMSIRVSSNSIRFTLPATVQPGTQRINARYQEFGTVNCPRMLTVVAVGAEVTT